MRKKKILCIGIKSTDNLGDVAISTMIGSLFLDSGAQVVCMEFNFRAEISEYFCLERRRAAGLGNFFSKYLSGRFTRRVFGLIKFLTYIPLVFFIFFRKSRGCSKVFIGGGNVLMGIEYGFPLQAFSYVVFSRLLGIPVSFLCVGAGPFTAPGVKHLLRTTLRLAHRVICRDTGSVNTISTELGRGLAILDFLPDPVLIWPEMSKSQELNFDVLFTFMPLFAPSIFPDGSHARCDNFIESAIDLVVGLVDSGKRIGIFVTDSGVDLEISQVIAAMAYERTGVKVDLIVPRSPSEMAEVVSKASAVVSTRMHGAIMAFSQSVPSFCVAWQPKIVGMYADLGMNDFLINLDAAGRFPVYEIFQRLGALCERREAVVDRIKVRRYNIKEQYSSFWHSL